MIDAANEAQEKYMQGELKAKNPKKDYSEMSIAEMVIEMKRLADEILGVKPKPCTCYRTDEHNIERDDFCPTHGAEYKTKEEKKQ
jgi:hypothetical protein